MELRIAVCDDAEEDRAYVSGLAKDWAAQAGHRAEITAFSSAESFLFRYRNGELQEVGSFAQDIRKIWVQN